MRNKQSGLARGFHVRTVQHDLGRPARSRQATSKIIPHDPAQDEPRCSYSALHGAADFGPSDSRVVAYRDFHDAKSRDGPFQDHFHRPAVGSLFERKSTKHIGPAGAKRSEVADLDAIQESDQTGG